LGTRIASAEVTVHAPESPRWRADVIVAALVFIASGIWATQFWNTWTAQGGQPEFYQIYFEPAVMVACGKGFVISNQQPKALEDFLWRRRDRLACTDLPADLKVGRNALYQEAWTYLQYAVGWSWRVLGISWSRMGPLFGLFFGTTTMLAYAIFRLGMGRLLAIVCAFGVATSPLHLLNLPHLRDYSKAPFTLGLVLIFGLIVTRPVRRRTVLLLAAAYGAVLGFGYGFRTDLLVDLPVLVIALFAFLGGGLTRNLTLKAAAAALFLATFFVVSWPITSAVYTKGGCQWHVALLGLQSPFEELLRIRPAPYDFGYAYADGFVIRGVQGFAHRTNPQGPTPQYCSHEYDVQSGRYLMTIATAFPGDLVVRAYASMLQIVEMPFLKLVPPARDWAASLFAARTAVLESRHSWGALLAMLALFAASAASVRLGLFLLFFLAYFGGYPAIQFQDRHYFPLEFIGWWALGFVVHQAITTLIAVRNGEQDARQLARRLVYRAGIVTVSGVIVFVGLLGAARWYQTRQARQILAAYVAAPKAPLEDPAAPLSAVASTDWPQFVEVDLDQASCGPRPTVTFQYDPAFPDADFTRTIAVERRASVAGPTRIFLPVFEHFTGLKFSDGRRGCVLGAYRFTDLEAFPLLLGATLPPDWQSRPLYQRLVRWERNPDL
jgi:hypothetical protein